jgi:glycosyltransferase involved in cell wall biosynthesis
MKIIIVHHRYFVAGGPERYLFNIIDLLEKNGHEIIPFSIKNKLNKPSIYEDYFLDPIGDDEVYFNEYKKTDVKTVFKSFSRMFYSFEAKKKLNKLIKAVTPDLIYVLQYQNKISVSIFDAAAKNKIPAIHRISDFGHICADNLFFRPRQQDICERCLIGNKLNAVYNKCVLDSYFYSSIKIASLKFQEIAGISKKVSSFVVPSKFTIGRLEAHGFPKQKLNHIPTFFNFNSDFKELPVSYEPFALYIGRISPEKGLFTLIKSFENTAFNLKIIGFPNHGFENALKDYLKGKSHKIEFLGKQNFSNIQIYLSKCAFTVVPSEWYDNLPNSILESYAFKKCVVATDIGSLKEIVINNQTGLLFKLKNVVDLRNKITYLFNNQKECRNLGSNAFISLNNEFSAESHYDKLITLFKNTRTNFSLKNV